MEILAVIPARGGSKGLVRKNVLPLAGHPLIAYSIQAALNSKLTTRVIVNTDAEYIAVEAKKYGAEVPFLRPANLAGDFSTDLEVFVHLLEWLKQTENYEPDLVVQLRPTSPVRPVGIIDQCVSELLDSTADSLRIVTKSPLTPYKMWIVGDDRREMIPLLTLPGVDEPYNQPRQLLPEVYWQIGCLDVIRANVIRSKNSMSGNSVLPHIVPSQFAVDIDDLESFRKAEQFLLSTDCERIP